MVSKDKWDTKEGTQECIVCTIVSQKASATTLNTEKIKPVTLAIVELHLSEGIRQLLNQAVNQFVSQ